MKQLLAHRLADSTSQDAKLEWYDLVEGRHSLWQGVSEPYKHMIRAFLVHFQLQILSQANQEFNFRNGSVGGVTARLESFNHQSLLGLTEIGGGLASALIEHIIDS